MFDSGLFSEPDIKSRAIALDVFKVGVKPAPRAFIHVAIRLLSGRSDEERKQLADAVKVPAGHRVFAETVGVGEITYECRLKAGSATSDHTQRVTASQNIAYSIQYLWIFCDELLHINPPLKC